MTQISRPFQIALVAVVLIAAVWFVALRGHSSSSSSSSASSAPPPAASGSAGSQRASGSTGSAGSASSGGSSTYHGSAPGVDGLTRAIQKAHGAVAESEQNAKALQQKSEQASGSAQAQGASAAGSQTGSGSSAATHRAATTGGTAAKHRAAKTHSSGAGSATKTSSKAAAPKTTETKSASAIPAMQARVEAQLKQGKVAALLFWNPKGSDDRTVRSELRSAAGKLHGKLAIDVALADQVGSFGSFTRTVQVYGTPTILLINPAGKTASLTGLTDVFSIEQAVREVAHTK